MSTDALRVLVVDDEPLARRRVTRLLGAMADVEIVGECDNADELLARVRDPGSALDVVLLDIQMPGLSGLEALQLLPTGGPHVIFCTAHDQHAVGAFAAGAVDYVLKPIGPARLSIAIERARSRLRPRPTSGALQRLALRSARGITLVDPLDVSHLVIDGELVSVHTRAGTFISDASLNELHERLPVDRFERVHRKAIVNLACVDRLEPLDTGGFTARVKDGSTIEISRQAARALRRRLGL